MKNHKLSKFFLVCISVIGLVLLPFAIFKRSTKDWVIINLVAVIGNSFIDKYLVLKGFLKYPHRLFPKYVIHLPFDFILYPLLLLYYNQWTVDSKPLGLFLKLFPFIIPQVIIETFAERKTKLITWRRGWGWHHSLISLALKLLVCRGIIAFIRRID
ncbi:CBO0543 family protein [Bacillus mesophilum]|uniref:Uncharacterized protein n=1 Tax=Bacillus mesophilum TaxID=1071718 RepID=A0A7V7RM58_9BACI|nr:CBO0543 family protein [Bacillus mesophilum]KAB2332955.1 hypothetical protein F7732_12815 [Bacillus mesophilum]